MTDSADPAFVLHDLGLATSRFVEQALAQLTPEAREAVAPALAAGARLAVIIDINPVFAVRLVLRPESGSVMTLATLVAEMPAERLQ